MKQAISILLAMLLLGSVAFAEGSVPEAGNVFTGSYGYTISLGDQVRAYNSEGCDNFVLNSEDNAAVFSISISSVAAIAMDDVKQNALSGKGMPCVLGAEDYAALRVRHEADGATGMIWETTLCPLADGSGLLIDAMWATGDKESANAQLVSDMLSTLKLAENAPSGEISYLYGLLKVIDTKDMLLSFQEAEALFDTDTKRIDQLKAQGVELDMPNGHTVYMPNELIIAQPYSQYAQVQMLNAEQTPEASDVNQLAERLEGHPEFLLCKLGILNGTIVAIEEVYLP